MGKIINIKNDYCFNTENIKHRDVNYLNSKKGIYEIGLTSDYEMPINEYKLIPFDNVRVDNELFTLSNGYITVKQDCDLILPILITTDASGSYQLHIIVNGNTKCQLLAYNSRSVIGSVLLSVKQNDKISFELYGYQDYKVRATGGLTYIQIGFIN